MCCDLTTAVFLSWWLFLILNRALQTKECKCIRNTQPQGFNLLSRLPNHFLSALYLLVPGERWIVIPPLPLNPMSPKPSYKVNCHFFLHYSKLAFASSKPIGDYASRMIYIKVGIKGKSVTWKKGVFATNLVCACQEVYSLPNLKRNQDNSQRYIPASGKSFHKDTFCLKFACEVRGKTSFPGEHM